MHFNKSLNNNENKEIRSNKQIKIGAILSYIAIIIEIVIYLLTIKLLTTYLGDDYGIYTAAITIIGLFTIDFGLSQAVTKFVCKYRSEQDNEGEKNFLGLLFKLYLILDVAIFIIATVTYIFLGHIYSSLSSSDVSVLRAAYLIVASFTLISFPFTPIDGLLSSAEDFVAVKIFGLIQKIVSASLMVAAIYLNLGMYAIILSRVIVSLVVIISKLIYLYFKLGFKVNIKYWDKKLLKSLFSFSIWIALMMLSSKLSLSFMPTVLGAVANNAKYQMGVFGFALTIETYAFSFSTVLSGMFLPKITRISTGKGDQNIQKIFEKVGKIQLFVIGLILVGFVVLGNDFAHFFAPNFAGNETFLCVLFLLFAVMTESPKTVASAQSYVLDTVKPIAIIEIIIAVVRLGFSFIFAKLFGAVGVAGTHFVFCLLGQILRDVFVYSKKQKLNMKSFYLKTYFPFAIVAVISIGISLLARYAVGETSAGNFAIIGILTTSVFGMLYYTFCFSNEEKKSLINKFSFFKKIQTKFPSLFKISQYGIPVIFCGVITGLGFLSSNYPIYKISLLLSILIFALLFFNNFYYKFPFYSINKKNILSFLKYYLLNPSLIFVILFSFCGLITFFLNMDVSSIWGIARVLLAFWIGFLFVECVPFSLFRKTFSTIFAFLCLYSLVIFLIINASGVNFSPLSFIYKGSNVYYNYFFLTFSPASTIDKNYGVFWENGIFASFCIIGIILETIFNKEKPSIFKLAIFTIVLLTTGSLAGYILLILSIPIISHFYAKKKLFKNISILLFVLLILLFVLFIATPLANVIPFIRDKGASLVTRIYSIDIDFKIFAKYPIFGCGGRYANLFAEIVSTGYNGIDASVSTFGYLIASFGLIGLIFCIFFVSSILTLKKQALFIRIGILVVTFLIANKEPHYLSVLSIILTFFALKNSSIGDFFGKIKHSDLSTFTIAFVKKNRKAQEEANNEQNI